MTENYPFRSFQSIVIFDVETTGLDSRFDTIIEFGGIKVTSENDNPEESDELDLLIQLPNGKKLGDQITKLTGITPSMLYQNGVAPNLAAETISGMLFGRDTLLVAYNAQFDLCFLYRFLKQYGREECLQGVKMLDALTVYKDRRPYPHKLCNAIESYRLNGQNSHRALDDAKATWELFCAMQKECADLERYINLFGYHPRYGISGPRIASVTYRAQEYDPGKKLYDFR